MNRLKISRGDGRYVLAFALIIGVLISSVAYVTLFPFTSQPYFAMWVLGSNGLAENYYPGNNPNVRIGEQINWTIGVYNKMGALEYVVVRVKLLNSTMLSPDDSTATPSPAPTIYEFRHVLLNNETWMAPFLWRVSNLTTQGQSLAVSGILLNGAPYSGILAVAVGGLNFRFVLELWFYDVQTNQLKYSWQYGSAQYSVWNQVWFNATLGSPP